MSKQIDKLYSDLSKVLKYKGLTKNLDFYVSSLTEYNPFYSTEEILSWLKELNKKRLFNVKQVPLGSLRQWDFEKNTGDLVHQSGKFFSIRGLSVKTNRGPVLEWSQPIIDQPEIGILGIITKKINGILYFLVQAKAEPGNITTFQLSPTVQATKSNYTRAHGGKRTPFLEYFLDSNQIVPLIDQLQSEQGARFFHKRNRNMIVRIPDNIELEMPSSLFRWVTLGQLLKLSQFNNTVNMDTRSVISNISFDPESKTSSSAIDKNQLADCLMSSKLLAKSVSDLAIDLLASAHSNSESYLTFDEILRLISQDKFKTELTSRLIPINQIKQWDVTDNEIYHLDKKFFSVIGVDISTETREVGSWDQPIIKQQDEGIVGFIIKKINGTLHFLVQLKLECGNMDLLELAPTVQCMTGSYSAKKAPLYVNDLIHSKNMNVVFDTMQSEEGGRFYQESNRNLLALVDDRFPIEQDRGYLWVTLSQIKALIKVNNFFNIEARSLLSQLEMV